MLLGGILYSILDVYLNSLFGKKWILEVKYPEYVSCGESTSDQTDGDFHCNFSVINFVGHGVGRYRLQKR